MISQKKNKIERKKSNREFNPSMKLLLRIAKTMLEKNYIGKTNLSLESKVNYVRLVKHLSWLEQKGFVEVTVEEGRVVVRLTRSGREFVMKLGVVL